MPWSPQNCALKTSNRRIFGAPPFTFTTHPMPTKSYFMWSEAETDFLLKWFSEPGNYDSYWNGVKARACSAIAEALKTKTKDQVRTSSLLAQFRICPSDRRLMWNNQRFIKK